LLLFPMRSVLKEKWPELRGPANPLKRISVKQLNGKPSPA